jgi:hypothetical protein
MPEPSWPTSAVCLANRLSKLPRELRDKIYAEALNADCPIQLTGDWLQHIPPMLRKNSDLLPEALEILPKIRPFTLDFDNLQVDEQSWARTCINLNDIRHLDIKCTELEESFVFEDLEEYEKKYQNLPSRRLWAGLMQFPRLQTLAIYMQKTRDNGSLNTFDFGPILYSLRAKHPKIDITFSMSFDEILRERWYDPTWYTNDVSAEAPPYEPMGFVDMSDLIAPPTSKDDTYVQEYLSAYMNTGRMPWNREIGHGLLDESPANRRLLAKHYAVKEPNLLRCLMRNHFEVYQNRLNGFLEEEAPETSAT